MAESTLSLSFSDMKAEVAGFLGYGVAPDGWGAEKLAEIERYVQSGLRQFYFPPAVNGIEAGYEWSFLKPTATVLTVADQGTNVLPDDFGRLLGDLHYAPTVHSPSIIIVGEARVLSLLAASADTGRPKFAAVRSKTSDGATGQRSELVFWPTPDAAYTLTYRYESYSGKLTDAKPYPLGGMRHSELIVESCLAVAESRANDESALHRDRFIALLASGIAQDRKAGAQYFGPMGGGEESGPVRSRMAGENYPITYKGETW